MVLWLTGTGRMREVAGLVTSHFLSHWTRTFSLFLEFPLNFKLPHNTEIKL